MVEEKQKLSRRVGEGAATSGEERREEEAQRALARLQFAVNSLSTPGSFPSGKAVVRIFIPKYRFPDKRKRRPSRALRGLRPRGRSLENEGDRTPPDVGPQAGEPPKERDRPARPSPRWAACLFLALLDTTNRGVGEQQEPLAGEEYDCSVPRANQ